MVRFAQKVSLLIFYSLLFTPLAYAQSSDCLNTSDKPGATNSPGGYAVQGENQCLPTADVNAGLDQGYTISPEMPLYDDSSGTTPADAANLMARCMESFGVYGPSNGTDIGSSDYPKALCYCNGVVFGQKFECYRTFFGDSGANFADMQLFETLRKDANAIVIFHVVLRRKCPPYHSFLYHAMQFRGVSQSIPSTKPRDVAQLGEPQHRSSSSGGPGGGTVLISDPNEPDETIEIQVGNDGSISSPDIWIDTDVARIRGVTVKLP
ncbi:MAG: hypothetical protein KDD66_17720, partial [Bdellovibrionales bacterium]|nr:hypothetical protein [Bdellovibrionales bacterium]